MPTAPRQTHRLLKVAAIVLPAALVGLVAVQKYTRPEPAQSAHLDRVSMGSTARLSALEIPTSNPMPPTADPGKPASVAEVEEVIADQGLPPLQKAQKLLDLTDHLSGDPALAACDFALLCLDEENYQPAFEKLVEDQVSLEVRQSIMADLMERSDFLRLPLLVQLASQTEHPFSEDARVELVTALGDDYGTNWLGWSDGVAEHLEFASGVSGASVVEHPRGDGLSE